jgi:hypothetical protein
MALSALLNDNKAADDTLRIDLPRFCANRVKIQPKQGGEPTPFMLNTARDGLHTR